MLRLGQVVASEPTSHFTRESLLEAITGLRCCPAIGQAQSVIRNRFYLPVESRTTSLAGTIVPTPPGGSCCAIVARRSAIVLSTIREAS